MKNYAILRVEKLKTRSEISARGGHNTRRRPQAHASNPSPLMGGGVRLVAGENDPLGALDRRAASCGAKPRKGAVLALEFVASASKEWFLAASPEERDHWLQSSLDFIQKTVGGSANVLAAHLHDDEENPHLHVITAPLVWKERKTAGRGGRQGSRAKKMGWAFAAADIVGGASRLSAMQTDYAKALADLGIRRGQPRKITQAKHKAPSVYRAEVAATVETEKRKVRQAATKVVRAKAEAATHAMTEGFDALDAGTAVYRPPTDERPEGISPADGVEADPKWAAFIRRLRPVYKPVVRYARALHKLAQRAREVDRLLAEVESLAHAARDEQSMASSRELQRKLNRVR